MDSCIPQLMVETRTENPGNVAGKQGKISYYLEHYAKLLRNYELDSENTKKRFRFKNGYNESLGYWSYLHGPNVLGWALSCVQDGYVFECPEDGLKVLKPFICGDRHRCVICGQRYTTAQVMAAMRLFNVLSLNGNLPNLYVSGIVFTLPLELRPRVGYGNFKIFNDVCLETIKEYHAGVMPAGFSVAHTWRSRRPLSGWNPHNHSFWLNYGFNKDPSYQAESSPLYWASGYVGDNYLIQMIPNFYDPVKLREIYKRRIEKAFKVRLDVIDVNIRYAKVDPDDEKCRRQLVHMLAYALRMPQKDVTEYSRGVVWDGKLRKYLQVRPPINVYDLEQTEHLGRILNPPKNWRRERWYGWLSDSVKAEYLGMLGISLDDVREPPEEDGDNGDVLCPRCHTKCVPLWLDPLKRTNRITASAAIAMFGKVYYPWDPGGGLPEDAQDGDPGSPAVPELPADASWKDIYKHEKMVIEWYEREFETAFIFDREVKAHAV